MNWDTWARVWLIVRFDADVIKRISQVGNERLAASTTDFYEGIASSLPQAIFAS